MRHCWPPMPQLQRNVSTVDGTINVRIPADVLKRTDSIQLFCTSHRASDSAEF
ncbi:hypothetical protein BD289DRAFT_426007 [Coniella lustricola]|uniref:Uncharacterized protein n=1 Tax=Coniella lustricola TaxID=2025994 RepID=A0A2T3AH14_9PEZI|nr:hypothetical protein BD289DRAFT_426007 [Coniella lustricola]